MTAVMERPTEARTASPMTVAPAWVERHCVVPDGFLQGRPFRLYRDQLRYFLAFYTVRATAEWDPERPITGPAFVYRRGLEVGPQKIGKDPRGAAHVCLEGAGPALFAGWAGTDEGYVCADHGCGCGWEYPYEPGEPMGMRWPTPLIQLTAFSEDQTDNVYDALRPMIELGPLADIITKTGEEFIRLPGGGRIETVTSSAPSRLGQRITFAKQGEAGLYTKRNGMEKVADTQYRNLAGTGGRATLDTNAWDPSERSVAQREFESADPGVYRQFTQPPASLSFGNKEERRKILRLVYPKDTWRENGGHVDLESIESEAAALAEHDLAQAARFFGNMLIAGSGSAVDPEAWDKLAQPREVPPGSRVALGFDGSLSQDSTVLRACTPDGYRFSLPGWSWVRPIGDEMRIWAASHPGEDWQVPRDLVEAAVADAFARFRVGLMLPDAAFWRDEITRWQRLYGEEIVRPFDTNSARKMAPAFDRWRTAITNGVAVHDGDPVVSAHVKAMHKASPRGAVRDDDGRLPLVPVKGDDRRKIDGGLADILAYEAAMTMPELEEIGVPEFFTL